MQILKFKLTSFQISMIVMLAFFALAFLVYFQTLSADFLAYDDRLNIIDNYLLRTHDIAFFWKNLYFGLYIPVTYSVWLSLDWLFGADGFYFHSLNILLHSVNAFLVFLILIRFQIKNSVAAIASAFFLLHPIQAEAASWATGLKDILSTFFILCFLFVGRNKNIGLKQKFFLIALYICSVLSKPTALALPFFMLLTDAATNLNLKSLKFDFKNFLIKNWHQLACAVLSLVTLSTLKMNSESATGQQDLTLIQRLQVVFDSLGFYLSKIVLPVNFYPDYGRIPSIIATQPDFLFNISVGLAYFLFVFIIVLNLKKIKKNPDLLIYSIVLIFSFFLPISGLVDFSFQNISTTADRYAYPIMAGIAFQIAFFATLNSKLSLLKRQKILLTGTVLVLVYLGFYTRLLTGVWQNNEIFFKHMFEGNPNSFNAVNNLGVLHQIKGENEIAISYFDKASKIRPNDITPLVGKMSIYLSQNKLTELDSTAAAVLSDKYLKSPLTSSYSIALAYKFYGQSLLQRDKKIEALDNFCRIEKYDPLIFNNNRNLIEQLSTSTGKECPTGSNK